MMEQKLKTHLVEDLLALQNNKSILTSDVDRIAREYFLSEDIDEFIGEFEEREISIQDYMRFVNEICYTFKYQLFLEKQTVLADILKAIENSEVEIVVPIDIYPKVVGYTFITTKLEEERAYRVAIIKEGEV